MRNEKACCGAEEYRRRAQGSTTVKGIRKYNNDQELLRITITTVRISSIVRSEDY